MILQNKVMKSVPFLFVVLSFIFSCKCSPNNFAGSYTSSFNSITAGGATGYFNYQVDNKGSGKYSWSVDLTNFVIPIAASNAGCTWPLIASLGLKCEIFICVATASFCLNEIAFLILQIIFIHFGTRHILDLESQSLPLIVEP